MSLPGRCPQRRNASTPVASPLYKHCMHIFILSYGHDFVPIDLQARIMQNMTSGLSCGVSHCTCIILPLVSLR